MGWSSRILASPRALMALALATVLVSTSRNGQAVGDAEPLDFGETHSSMQLSQRIRGAPRGRLVRLMRDPTLAWGPFVRSPNSIWVGRRDGGPRSDLAELVELNAAGESLRIHAVGGPWGPNPCFTALGNIVGVSSRRMVTAWSPEGAQIWRSHRPLVDPQYLQPDTQGGVYVAVTRAGFHRFDHRGNILWSAEDARPLRAPPLVLPSGFSVSCTQPHGELVARHPDGKIAWRDPKARCTHSPREVTGGRLVVPGEDVLRFYRQSGELERSVSFKGRLGPVLVAEDGSLALTTDRGVLLSLSATGQPRWWFPLGKIHAQTRVYSSPAGGLITTSQEGHLLSLDVRGRLLWHYPVPSPAPTLWVRADGAVLVLTPGEGLRLIAPPAARHATSMSKR